MGVHTETIQKLYVAYFSRPADPPGLTYWEEVVTKANGDTASVAAAFAAAQEYQSLFDGLDENGVVDLIYHNLFGRGAEPAALAYWGEGLKKHAFTIAEAVTTIARGAQGSDKTAFGNKLAASLAFTNALDTVQEVLAFRGDAPNGLVQKWLSAITTADSLQASLAGLDALIDRLVSGSFDRSGSVFETVDLVTLPIAYDAQALASHKQAIEFIATAPVGLVSVDNLAPSSSFRVKGDLGDSIVMLTQKLPGSLKITLDADEWVADAATDTVTAHVIANNAHALKVSFDTSFMGAVPGENDPTDNTVSLGLTGVASKLDVATRGLYAKNVLTYKDAGFATLQTMTVTGDKSLTLNTEQTFGLAQIDAAQHTGGLSVATESLKDGGLIKLGSGIDRVAISDAQGPIRTDAIKSIQFLQMATADAANGDLLVLDPDAKVADAHPGLAGGVVANGVLTFSGAAPASLAAAIALADAAAETVGEVVVFAYQNDSYVFMQSGSAEDAIVRLVGTAGVSGLAEIGDSGQFFVV